MGVHHQVQFPDSLANTAQEMGDHGQLGEALARLQGCFLGQEKTGSMRSFGTIKFSLMQETRVFTQPLSLQVRTELAGL